MLTSYKLGGHCIWDVCAKPADSTSWKRLLAVHDEVKTKLGSIVCRQLVAMDKRVRLSCMYDAFWPPKDEVSWYHLVWSSYHPPRYSFIAWLVCIDRLPTKVHIISYVPGIDVRCSFCFMDSEITEHLFFKCDYAHVVGLMLMSSLSKIGLEFLLVLGISKAQCGN